MLPESYFMILSSCMSGKEQGARLQTACIIRVLSNLKEVQKPLEENACHSQERKL